MSKSATTFNRAHLESTAARIDCGGERGSGFAVDSRRIITAYHCVASHLENGDSIQVEFPNLEKGRSYSAQLAIHDKTLDLAVLSLDTAPTNITPLPLSSSPLQYDAAWETYGFPISKREAGARIAGTVSRSAKTSVSHWDVDLVIYGQPAPGDAAGLSGAPIVIGSSILAVIVRELDAPGNFAAVSVSKARELLRRASISYMEATDALPPGIEAQARQAVLNLADQQELELAILEARTGYIACSGSPGSGKTTFTALFSPRDQQVRILGRYFVRRPNDNLPISHRAAETTIAQWIINVSAEALGQHVTSARDAESLTALAQAVSLCLAEISRNFEKEILVILFDGIEEATQANPSQRLFSIFPTTLPPNLVIVFTTSRPDILPPSAIPLKRQISLTALDRYACEALINRAINREVEHDEVDEIVRRSGGHPLYLHYLLEALRQTSQDVPLSEALDSIPPFSGHIKDYYDGIFKSLSNEPSATFVLATIARLRSWVQPELLLLALPDSARFTWPSVHPRIAHLLQDLENGIFIYHPSFADYIEERTRASADEIHQNLWLACSKMPNNRYSASNTLHHRLNGGETFRSYAIAECTQPWADKCIEMQVEPEFVLADIGEAVRAALGIGDLPSVVRLMLLRQRLHFRYDKLFIPLAEHLAHALISLAQCASVPQYVIRNSELIIRDEAALHLVELLINAGAKHEAESILHILTRNVESRIEGSSIAFGDLITLQRCYIAGLDLEPDSNQNQSRYDRFIRFISSTAKYQEKSEQITLMSALGGTALAYRIWKDGDYPSIAEVEARYERSIDESVLPSLLLAAEQYLSYESLTLRLGNGTEAFRQLVSDVQTIIKRNGVSDKYRVHAARLLLNHGTDVKLIEELCLQFGVPLKIELRRKNGVDADFAALSLLYGAYEMAGYCNRVSEPRLSPITRTTWMESIEELVMFVGYMSGKAHRFQQEGLAEQLANLASRVLDAFTTKLPFTLKERTKWDRSYALPEQLLPFVYEKATQLIGRFAPKLVSNWVGHLLKHVQNQWGIYTEGFREACVNVLEATVRELRPLPRAAVFPLVKALEQHIVAGVQNRIERTSLLLRIVPLYKAIGSDDRARRSFVEMLKTSMGPDWYKEAQLSLLNTVLEMDCGASSQPFSARVASHLEVASGEMTFGRYVRYERASFVGALCQLGRLEAAVQYYKYGTIPDTDVIIAQVRAPSIDRVDDESGYNFGVGNIEEQDAILEILRRAPNIDPHLRWAFAEIFCVSSEREIDQYAKIFAEILEQSSGEKRSLFARRFASFSGSDLDEAYRKIIFSTLTSKISTATSLLLSEALEKYGIKLNRNEALEQLPVSQQAESNVEKMEDELLLPGTFGTRASLKALREALEAARNEAALENSSAVREILSKGLSGLTQGGWTFWSSSIGEAEDALKLLRSHCESDEHFVRTIAPLIEEDPFAQDWVKVDSLLKLIGHPATENTKSHIAQVVDEHFAVVLGANIQPPLVLIDSVSDNSNHVLVGLLIWYLDYPDFVTKYRVSARLEWLCHILPGTLIPSLLRHALLEAPGFSSEIAAGILHAAVAKAPNLWSYFGSAEAYSKAALAVRHLGIRDALIRTAHAARQTIPEESPPSSAVGDNECSATQIPEWASVVGEEVASITNADPSLIGVFVSSTQGLCKPLLPTDHAAADSYIDRWLGRSSGKWSRFAGIMHTAISAYVVPRLPPEARSTATKSLRLYNPEWPEADLAPNRHRVANAIDAFLKSRSSLAACYSTPEHIYLHFFEVVYSRSKSSRGGVQAEAYEVICFLVHPLLWGQHFDPDDLYELYDTLEFSNKPSQAAALFLPYAPLIFKSSSQSQLLIGGRCTPSRVHPNLISMCGVTDKDARRETWRTGTRWESSVRGLPEREGCALFVSADKIRPPKDFQLAWMVLRNGWPQFIANRSGQHILLSGSQEPRT